MPKSKQYTIADYVSTALTDDKFSDEEFRLILSEVDKYSQIKADIHGRQYRIFVCQRLKKELIQKISEEAMATISTKLMEDLKYGTFP